MDVTITTTYTYDETTPGLPADVPIWALSPLYKKNQREDRILYWRVHFVREDAHLYMTHGMVDGAMQVDKVAIKLNKSGRTLQEQALLEARKRYIDTQRKGYTTDPSGKVVVFLPQLANKWSWEGKDYKVRALGPAHFDQGRVVVQVKLDGMRACATLGERGRVELRYRKGERIEWLDHLKDELGHLLDCFARIGVDDGSGDLYELEWHEHLPQGLPEEWTRGLVLDGELTIPLPSHDDGDTDVDAVRAAAIASRQVLNSVIRKVHEKHPDNDRVHYNLFDIFVSSMPDMPLEERIALTEYAFYKHRQTYPVGKSSVSLIPMVRVEDLDDLKKQYEVALAQGHEGLVIRKLWLGAKGAAAKKESLYTHSRNNNLLKLKPFDDDEAEIVGIESAHGRDEGTAIFILRMPSGIEFAVRPIGTLEERKYYYEHPDEFIGQSYTYNYRGLSDTGVPQHATGGGFRHDL